MESSRVIKSELDVLRRALELQDSLEGIRQDARALVARADRAGVAAPVFLRELAGLMHDDSPSGPFIVPRLHPPTEEPPDLGEDAIWIDATSPAVAVKTLVLALLAQEGRRMPVRELLEAFHKYREVSAGTLANAGTALAREGVIDRDKGEGWALEPGNATAVLFEGYLWGQPALFGKTEVAWFRREAIKHVLRTLGGQQQMQIVDMLKGLAWVHGPKEKDIVKMDLEALRAEGCINRVSHSRKWVLKPEEA